MLNHKVTLKKLMFAVACAGLSVSGYAAPLHILEFKKAQFSQTQKNALCTQVKTLCDQQGQLQSLKTPDQHVWVLVDKTIAEFDVVAKELKLLKYWQIKLSPTEETMTSKPYIFPRLFPMQANRYAVAMIDTTTEMYSGGGANIERASFYELEADGHTRQFIQDYPFYFYRMIRACFSEDDFKVSKGQCHDEDWLSVDIQPIKPMLWQFKYRYHLQVSPVSDSGQKSFKGSKIVKIDLDHVPKRPNIPEQWDYEGMN
ncbi:hypothetical protein [Acinetobacter sp. MD2(2019)]|uniref:hypothetical protein n=1 Tax=Acinetobacter sp. MD2(2019) TaxID=2605273 RepID=UPI002D1EC7FF|nr:hypothetical protein [Acinetobacter sp. MD2(2019)]MEB3753898.1 hypothetical protein [Acinetobacter sp. MD2(2019)]